MCIHTYIHTQIHAQNINYIHVQIGVIPNLQIKRANLALQQVMYTYKHSYQDQIRTDYR